MSLKKARNIFNKQADRAAPAFTMLWPSVPDMPVVDPSSVADWNAFINGGGGAANYTSVLLNGNTVTLKGGSSVILPEFLLSGSTIISARDTGSVIEIRDACFGASDISSAFFSHVITLGASAFTDCLSLTYIYFEKVEIVSDSCFMGCPQISGEISLPSCLEIQSLAFADCSKITSVQAPLCLTIGVGAFSDCSLLVSIYFPVITTIPAECFRDNVKLVNITAPLVTNIGQLGVAGTILVTDYNTVFPLLTTIGAAAMFGCSGLVSLNFPYVTSIGTQAFQSCTNVLTAGFQRATSIAGAAFSGCIKLITVSAPSYSPTSIPSSLFGSCNALRIIDMDFSQATSIQVAAFQSCSSLSGIMSFPNVTTITASVFNGCSSLTAVLIPKLTSITGAGSFSNCSSITSFDFPLLTAITGNTTFTSCTGIREFNFPLLTTVATNTFIGTAAIKYNLPALTTCGINTFSSLVTSSNAIEFYLPVCNNLGGTVGDNNVFAGFINKTIRLTIPASRMTANGGLPDGDIVELMTNNPATTIVTT